jgi:hypothetical protein
VFDPELDESIVDCGFVEFLDIRDGHVTLRLRLPTYWCAPNFVYLMAEDARRELLQADGVSGVTIEVGDHCDSAAIESGVNRGRPFEEAFPAEAAAGLHELRRTFLRKAFLKRQEALLEALAAQGHAWSEVARYKIRDLAALGAARGCAESYLERRSRLGLSCEPDAALIVDPDGREVPAAGLPAYLKSARAVRVAMQASSAFCCAVLAARRDSEPAGLVQIGGAHVPAG